MTRDILSAIGAATATGVLGGWIIAQLMRGRRPAPGVYVQLLGTLLLTLAFHLGGSHPLRRSVDALFLVGVVLLTGGVLAQSRPPERVPADER